MKKRMVLLCTLLSLAACTGSPGAAQTPTETTLPPASSTPTREPVKTPTSTPIPDQLAQELETIHMVMFLVQVDTELLSEAARRVDAEDLETDEALAIYTTVRAEYLPVFQNTTGMPIPDELLEPWNDARQVLVLVAATYDQWSAGQIDPEGVLSQMQIARQSAVDALDAVVAEIGRIVGFDTDAQEVRAANEAAIDTILREAFGAGQQVSGCGDPVQGGAADAPSGKIAFVSTRDGNAEIYVINVDGSGATRLTNHPAGDFAPAWSPDGTRIAFYSERDGNAEIYVVNVDGSGLTRLTDNPANDYAPSWSPDGTQIAFHSHRYLGSGRIFVMNADGTGVTRLTDPSFDDWSPDWSPDGTQIVFNSSRSPSRDIWIINADGSSMRQLTFNDSDEWWPDWSPDGARIAMHSDRNGHLDIYTVRVDGSETSRVTDHPANDYDPSWSPDSAWIAFTSDRDGNMEICIVSADGSELFNVTNHPGGDWAAAWKP